VLNYNTGWRLLSGARALLYALVLTQLCAIGQSFAGEMYHGPEPLKMDPEVSAILRTPRVVEWSYQLLRKQSAVLNYMIRSRINENLSVCKLLFRKLGDPNKTIAIFEAHIRYVGPKHEPVVTSVGELSVFP
jgi:hypothetical protein